MIEQDSLIALLESELSTRDAGAFVHVGSPRAPAVRYCLAGVDREERTRGPDSVEAIHAVAFDGSTWSHSRNQGPGTTCSELHPADELATRLAESGVSGTILTPPSIPHDAALYLEQAGFELASSDVLTRARRSKSDDERIRIERVQEAAAAGMRRAATVLAEATTRTADRAERTDDGTVRTEDGTEQANATDDRALVFDGEGLTAERLRTAIDEAIVTSGSFPDGITTVEPATSDGVLRAGKPIGIAVSPRTLEGYHGGLIRTFVVDGDGGGRRRAHVALTRAFRSVRSKLTAATHSVTAVEADLEAEIRAFGFGDADAIETRVTGVGLEPREAPAAADADVGPETVVRIEAAVRADDEQLIRLADLLVPGEPARWLEAPSRSLDPADLLQ